MSQSWRDIVFPVPSQDEPWETFHENSKTSRYEPQLPGAQLLKRMDEMWEAYPYRGYAAPVPLPKTPMKLELSLHDAILRRATARSMKPAPISIDQLAALLHYSYGITRDNQDTVFPRPFRTTPSGGGLYPLEIFFHTSQVGGLRTGLHHYDPTGNSIRCIYEGDRSRLISDAMVQNNLALDASVIFFVTAVFERSTFKYLNRGYRFICIEAGHLAQNMNLVAVALGLGSVNIGGYFDRQIDDVLELDGLSHSTIYMIAIGHEVGDAC
jgi:SagB-type dehydrogenase family enzyme